MLAFTMELVRPHALWGLAILPLLYWLFCRSLVDLPLQQRRASLAVRCVMVVILLFALAGITLLVSHHRQHVVLVIDQSTSVGKDARAIADAFAQQTEAACGDHMVSVVAYPSDATESTDLAAALGYGAIHTKPSYVPHLVLLTDGNETQGDALAAAQAQNARISIVPLPSRKEAEVQIASVTAPARVREGEPFYLDINIGASLPQDATVEVFRGPHRVINQTIKLREGDNELRLRQSFRDMRVAQYTVRVTAKDDALMDNNAADVLIFTAGKPRVLLIDPQPNTAAHLVRSLAEQDIAVESRPPAGTPTELSDLQNYDLLILSNTPATALSFEQMDTARAYVQDLGGGLLMIGGDQSFGLGGYYKTAIEQLLPVRSDFESEKQKPSLAMVLVIDKSGSMGGMKIELAKDAARGAIELLTARDQVGVIAFDGQPYWISRMGSAADQARLQREVASLTSGGGTNLAPAIQQAYESLLETSAALKHVIILSDGHSAQGDYDNITRNMAAARITASTVGVGQGADKALLSMIADVGGGRYYFTEDPRSIPQIFAKETIEAGRSAIHEEPFLPQVLRATDAIDGIDFAAAPYLLGYVSTRAKPTSEVILLSERGEPLLAWWRHGLGMTAAFTSDAKPRWAAEWIGWSGYGRFWSQVVRHVMRKSSGHGLHLRIDQQETKAHLIIDAVGDHGALLDGRTIDVTVVGPDKQLHTLRAEQTAPGMYEATIETPQRGAYHLEAVDGDRARQSRGMVVGYPKELHIKPPHETLLKSIASETGGLYNPKPADLFAPTDQTAQRPIPLRPYLLAAAIMLFVVDVALRRVELRVK